MTAKHYLEIIENKRVKNTSLYSRKEMIKFAEAYHKAKVNAITDEMIEKFWNDKEYPMYGMARRAGAEWFKQELLKE